MKVILIYFTLFLASNCIAAWLCMFDYTLTMRPWSVLLHLPPLAWLAAIAVNPFVELFFNWWAHLLANLLYAGLAWAWTKYRGRMSQPAAILLGFAVGGGLSLLVQSLRTTRIHPVEVTMLGNVVHLNWWLHPSPVLVAKLFVIYATTGLFCGWLYYRWVIAKAQLPSVAPLP